MVCGRSRSPSPPSKARRVEDGRLPLRVGPTAVAHAAANKISSLAPAAAGARAGIRGRVAAACVRGAPKPGPVVAPLSARRGAARDGDSSSNASLRSSGRGSKPDPAAAAADSDGELQLTLAVKENVELLRLVVAQRGRHRQLTREMGGLSQEYGGRVTTIRRDAQRELARKDEHAAAKAAEITKLRAMIVDCETRAADAEGREKASESAMAETAAIYTKTVELRAEREAEAATVCSDVLDEKGRRGRMEKSLAELEGTREKSVMDLDAINRRVAAATKEERECVAAYGDKVRHLDELEQKIEDLKQKKGIV